MNCHLEGQHKEKEMQLIEIKIEVSKTDLVAKTILKNRIILKKKMIKALKHIQKRKNSRKMNKRGKKLSK